MDTQTQTAAGIAPHGSLLVDLKGAAQMLGLSPWQVRGLVASKELRVVQVGRKFYFRKASLVRWAERSEA